MSNQTVYCHLGTLSMHPCFQSKQAHAEAMRTTLCGLCAHPTPGATGVDVWLQERAPRDKPLNFLYGCGIGLIHQLFIELLASVVDVDRDLFLGRVYNNYDQECTEWRTFHGRRKVIVRGSKDAHYRTCNACGRNIYHATGRPYLYPAPPADAVIFGSDLTGLVVPASLGPLVKAKRWRRVSVEMLPVLDAPADGLGLVPYRESVDPTSSLS